MTPSKASLSTKAEELQNGLVDAFKNELIAWANEDIWTMAAVLTQSPTCPKDLKSLGELVLKASEVMVRLDKHKE